jgi:hypothetical protein
MAKFKVGQVVYVTDSDLGYKDEVGEISTVKPYIDGKTLYGVILKEGNSLPKYFYEDEIKSLLKTKVENILLTLAALIWVSLVFVYLSPKEKTSKGYENLVYFQEVVNNQEDETKY